MWNVQRHKNLWFIYMRTVTQTDFSVLLSFRQCVDTRILRNYSLPWTQIHTVPCHFASVDLLAIARIFPSTSTVPVDHQWTQTASATFGNLYGGGRMIQLQEDEGLTYASMTHGVILRAHGVTWGFYSLFCLLFLDILFLSVYGSKSLKLSS